MEDGKNGEIRYLGKLRNALRHTIWQTTLVSLYNQQSAVMAHETRPYADIDKRVLIMNVIFSEWPQ